jgi:16S rRNA pseudouridine516 synthase
MRWSQVLFSQGFGARRECEGLIVSGFVRHAGVVVDDPDAEVATEGLVFEVEGRTWPYHQPAGYECSQKPGAHPSVMSLLPVPLRLRGGKKGGAADGVQPVGRLDVDTTGLLLLTDDGALLHKLTSPKHKVPKVYELTVADPVTEAAVAKLLAGVVLNDDPKPVRAAACVRTGDHTLTLTITEGKYHQIKRMLGAVGNRVTALHRSSIGALSLPADLAPGQWRWIDTAQRAELIGPSRGEILKAP